jgi:hypothetical protein
MADLAKRAEDVVTQAAEGSLRFGDAARFARYQEESLAAHGLKPLESQPLVDAILRETKNPQIAGNRELEIGLNRIANDIKKWTDNNGIIDAWALDSIRKNSINSVARQLYQNDAKAQRIFAGKVIESTKPLIIKAVEESGGSGYGQYLKDYMAGMESIAQNKLGAKAMELYKNNPTAFVRFVEGNEPEIVEGVLGQGKYNVFKDLAESTRQRLENVSSQLVREKAIGEQAKEGTTRLQEILKKESSMFSRFPHILNRKAVIANTALEELENHVNKKTWHALTEASKSAKSFNDLISQLPASEKSDFLKAWKQVNPESFKKFAVGVQVPFQNDNRNDPLNLNMQVKLPGE